MRNLVSRRLTMIVLLFIAGAVIAQFVAFGVLAILGQDGFMKYGQLISYPIMFIPPMIYNAKVSRKGRFFGEEGYDLDNSNFAPTGFPGCALLVSLGTMALAFIVEPVTGLLPDMPENLKKAMSMLLDGPLWISVLCVSVMAPFFEEWLCRGTVLRGLLCRMKPAYAIMLSALFFAVIHLNPWQGIAAFSLGCFFGWVYYRTGSLKLTMLMHCVNNTMSIVAAKVFGSEVETFRELFTSDFRYRLAFICCAAMLALIIRSLRRISPEVLRKGKGVEFTDIDNA